MSEADQTDLPTWTCEACGTQLNALTEHRLRRKRQSHAADCDAEATDTDESDAHYTIEATPPREVEAYAVTQHFHHMLVRREDSEPTRAIVEATLAEGQIEATDVPDRFIFTHRCESWPWRVVVRARGDAFLHPDPDHLLLTVYSPASRAHQEVSKYV